MTAWPRLDYAAEHTTYETVHLLLQLIGKLPTRLLPWENHGWHVALRVTPRGFITRDISSDAGHFTVELDMREGAIRVTCETGTLELVPVAERTIAQVHAELTEALERLGLPAPLSGGPNELPDPVPFAEDARPRDWDEDAVLRLHGAFLCADRVFNRFRSLYRGKCSPSHLFWGSFDLAVTRFSGRAAPVHPGGIPNLPDSVTREAYSAEEISAGFWLGGGGVEEAAFYAYAYPMPDGLADAAVAPDAAGWNTDLGEFVLPYAAVREAPDPGEALMQFLQSTWEAGAVLLDWPSQLTSAKASIGSPPSS